MSDVLSVTIDVTVDADSGDVEVDCVDDESDKTETEDAERVVLGYKAGDTVMISGNMYVIDWVDYSPGYGGEDTTMRFTMENGLTIGGPIDSVLGILEDF